MDIFSLLCVLINGDVSHLKTMAFGRKASSIKPFSGYHYDAPISSTLPNTFLPEIVINRGELYYAGMRILFRSYLEFICNTIFS